VRVSKRTKQALILGALVAALVIGAGAAVAGGGLGFDNDQQAFLDNAATRLGVTPAELKTALQGAYGDRLDAAVAAGKITKEQADALKQRAKDGIPLFGGRHGGPGGFGFHASASLTAAATYLGLTEAELRAELQAGKTLAQVAKAKGKSVDGLETALAAEAKKKLAAAVKAGTLTQAQADEIEKRLNEHLDDLVNGTGGPGFGHRGHGFGGPPPAGGQPPSAYAPITPAGSTV
jgi:hypothetical protein